MADGPAQDERIARIQQYVEQTYRTRRLVVPGHEERSMGGAISQAEGELLRDLVAEHKPKRTIEVGMGSGLSGVHICWGLLLAGGDGQHTAIDPFQKGRDWKGMALDMRDHLGLTDLFDWLCEFSDAALPRMVADKQTVDFAFIDGDHRFETALIDFYYIDKLLPIGGVVVFDDADWPSVRRVVRFCERHRHYERLGGSAVEVGPLTRPWGWRFRKRRRQRYAGFGWPPNEANLPDLFESVAYRKTADDDRDWRFWASLEERG